MFTFRRTSIQRKLVMVAMVTSSTTLILASALFIGIALIGVRFYIAKDVRGLSRIMAVAGRAPLQNNDRQTATTVLNALRDRESVDFAAIYDSRGRLFASYPATLRAKDRPRPLSRPGERWIHGRMHVLSEITDASGRHTGLFQVVRNQRDVARVFGAYLWAVGAVFVLCFVAAVYIASRLQRLISARILKLASTAKLVSSTQDFSIRARRHGSDEIGDLFVCFNDMLDHIQAREADLERVNLELQRSQETVLGASQAKSEFLANMSHELRTPLNAIIGYSEMLQEEAVDCGDEAKLADLQKITTAGRHLLTLINDVLDLSKIEAGKITLCPEEFDVALVVQDVASTVQTLVQNNNNHLTVVAEPNLGRMYADATRLRQGLLNLLSNAAKFTRDGEVKLEAGRHTDDAADILVFTVSDTGIGIRPDQMDRLFKPFSQADASTTRKYGGTGLGLAITRSFCEMMGGSITVESRPEEGSTFTIRLPAGPPPPADSPQPVTDAPGETPEAAGSATGSARDSRPVALVIDDDPATCGLLTRFLEREGYHGESALDGQSGLDAARRLKPSLITLDVLMPHLDGWDVLSRLKADPELAHIPVIILTMTENSELGYALGASEFITKPIDRERLSAVIERLRTSAPGQTVLVVDDDALARSQLKTWLESDGYHVLEAEDGHAALRCLAETRPSLIVLDLVMPSMSGFELASHLHASAEWQTIPVIVVTAMDITPADQKSLSKSVMRILRKDACARDELLSEVRRLIGFAARSRPLRDAPDRAHPIEAEAYR